MNDIQKLDEICGTFVKSLLCNKMDNPALYEELKARITVLIELEIKWKFMHDETQNLMQVWGPSLLN